MPISLQALGGYVLEELLARLIRNTGYRLIVDPRQDPIELENSGNGLVVRGRGGRHQVDVLGELAWIPAFTFPLRLFVEAKARGTRTGIPDVRNAVGVLTDVNQNFASAASASRAPVPRFSYRYALFSTSGFSRPAAEYALAHQISLIDLSLADFDDIIELAQDIAAASHDELRGGGRRIRDFRAQLRSRLGTWPLDGEDPQSQTVTDRWFETVVSRTNLERRVQAIGELFVGMASGPYLFVLRSRDPASRRRTVRGGLAAARDDHLAGRGGSARAVDSHAGARAASPADVRPPGGSRRLGLR